MGMQDQYRKIKNILKKYSAGVSAQIRISALTDSSPRHFLYDTPSSSAFSPNSSSLPSHQRTTTSSHHQHFIFYRHYIYTLPLLNLYPFPLRCTTSQVIDQTILTGRCPNGLDHGPRSGGRGDLAFHPSPPLTPLHVPSSSIMVASVQRLRKEPRAKPTQYLNLHLENCRRGNCSTSYSSSTKRSSQGLLKMKLREESASHSLL
ncbi:hypothetical protein GGR52DRAFT_64109 [Hypoxylon sp. FL1284]|nr:hypothetical protein GGR52DRAFT_64109 [Hypoxylon sp. FL1284]